MRHPDIPSLTISGTISRIDNLPLNTYATSAVDIPSIGLEITFFLNFGSLPPANHKISDSVAAAINSTPPSPIVHSLFRGSFQYPSGSSALKVMPKSDGISEPLMVMVFPSMEYDILFDTS